MRCISAALTSRQQGRTIKTARIIEDANGYRLVGEGGQSLYLTELAVDGGVHIVDGDCRLVDYVSFECLKQASNELPRALS